MFNSNFAKVTDDPISWAKISSVLKRLRNGKAADANRNPVRFTNL